MSHMGVISTCRRIQAGRARNSRRKRRQFIGNEKIAFADEQKRNAHEKIAFADEQKRNAREEIAFPDCGRGVTKELPVVSVILCKRRFRVSR